MKLNKPLLPNITNEIFKDLNNDELTSDDYLKLYSIFGEIFTRALELLDKATFTLLSTQDGLRRCVRVETNSTQMYHLYLNVNYCSCQAFKYQVLTSAQDLTCKHVLAVKLAVMLNKCAQQTLTSKQIMDIMKMSMFTDD
ncbi:zinc finger SWIM domain-containing protein 7-like [Chrysoperla carnea]|uniref:zinc finger SWIM domain-containing protein 7-like n=1 Tax=Chrysoperla carnea TaxID=189513 RepID=UPI001D092E74|nr:zinc finger SWIM domain-containing protein 7-like [Chrysoperla carnea]